MKSISIRLFLIVLCAWTLAAVPTLWGDPPSRVGRLNYVSGAVSFHPESVNEWAPATLNYPLTIGDNLWTDQNGQAEVHVGSTAIRLGPSTGISFLNLDDQTIQIRLSTGSLNLRLRQLGATEQIEVDTPEASFSLLRAGSYRVDVQQSGDTTITVRTGEGEVTAGGSTFPLSLQQKVEITGLDSPTYQVMGAAPLDGWDLWCQARDRKEDHIASAQYVPADNIDGVADLDQYGSWSVDPNLGPVWAPAVTVAGWAPYRFGHWAWVDPWGWTWIDDAPWGFAPFHYGRWAFRSSGWVWVPGSHVSRAVYAPALVTFVGGTDWRPSQAPGGSVGWFPLGPHEPYVPPYRSDRTRLHNVDVARINYVNRAVPGAVTVVPNEAFVRGQPPGRAALLLPNDELGRAPVRGAVSPLVPQKESLLGSAVVTPVRVAQPPASLISRPVVARRAPPPQTVPFAARQQALSAHPGQPLDAGTLSNLSRSAPAARSPVTVVTPKKAVVQPSVSPQRRAKGSASPNPMPRQPVAPAAGRSGAVTQPSARQPAAPAGGRSGTVTQPSARQPAAPAAGRAGTATQPSARQPAAPAGGQAGNTRSAPRDDKLLKPPGN
jgi:Family of unknown function (DUF6600)